MLSFAQARLESEKIRATERNLRISSCQDHKKQGFYLSRVQQVLLQSFLTKEDAFQISKFSKPLRTPVRQSWFSETSCSSTKELWGFNFPSPTIHHSIRWRHLGRIHRRDSNRDSTHTSPSSVKMESAFRGSKCLISKLLRWFSTVSWTCIGSTPAQREQNTWQMQCSPMERSISHFPMRTETTPKFINTEKMREPSVILQSHTDTDLQILHLFSSMLNCSGSQEVTLVPFSCSPHQTHKKQCQSSPGLLLVWHQNAGVS